MTVHENPLNSAEPEPEQEDAFEVASPSDVTPTPELVSPVSLKPSRSTILLRRIVLSALLWIAVFGAIWFLRAQPDSANPKVLPLTTYPGLEYMPSLSPDGKQVAFAWTGSNPTDPYGVYVKPIGDERAHRLAETPAGAADGDPVWSPDGKSIYFYRRGGEQSGIYIAPAEGGSAHLLIATSLGGRRLRRGRFDVSPTEPCVGLSR